ncbi:Calcium-binding EF-hand family protein [Forsythia ovata]|uniref:Calcium-binding EF-hand family protein n=1 Tax=Forsythia ovata TaxID=205694 RepID=A0ABD1NW67_9LAMI
MEEIRKVARACFQRGSSEKKELEDIGKVARAYFERSSSEEKTSARVFFGELDDNGDGKISVQEFESVTSSSHVKDLFKNLDENGDGILDFNEVLAFYYMEKTGVPGCGSCKELLLGPYFSCATCLGKGSESYDLCCDCYSGGEYSHEHSLDNFMDTRAQLKLLRDLMKNAEITPGQVII